MIVSEKATFAGWPARKGSTVLLNEFEVMCQEAGWPGETKEVGRNTSLATLIRRTARKALLQMSTRKRAGELLRRALSA